MTIAAVLSGAKRWHVECGDCAEILPTIASRSVDHVVADPPYSRHTHEGMRGNRGEDGIATRDCGFGHLTPKLRHSIASNACRIAKGWIVVFSDWESIWLWRMSIEAAGGSWRRPIPWVRWSSPQFNEQAPPSASEAVCIAKPISRARTWLNGGRTHYDAKCLRNVNKIGEHSTEKPEALMMMIASDIAVPGDVIIDCTCGSGTTLVAGLRLGMRVIGIEQKPEYAHVAAQRCEAECSLSTLKALRSGQASLFGAR